MLNYLRGPTDSDDASSNRAPKRAEDPVDFTISDVTRQLKALRLQLEATGQTGSTLSEEKQQQLTDVLKSQLQKNLTSDFIFSLEKKYGDSIIDKVLVENIEQKMLRTENRLSSAIDGLNRRGNLNLVIGAITTLIAIGILSTALFQSSLPEDPQALVIELFPRITLSVFIQIFSFFFLRLYSASLSDIKFYQNELTNIQSKFIALRRAAYAGSADSLTRILELLANTERNFTLKRGESTVFIEQAKIEQAGTKDFINFLLKKNEGN